MEWREVHYWTTYYQGTSLDSITQNCADMLTIWILASHFEELDRKHMYMIMLYGKE